jgi:hypothetical protein
MLDATQPADGERQPTPWNAIGQQEVQVLVLDHPVYHGAHRHRNVIRLQYSAARGIP